MLGYKAGTYISLGAYAWHLHEDLDLNDCASKYGVWDPHHMIWSVCGLLADFNMPTAHAWAVFPAAGVRYPPCCAMGTQSSNLPPLTIQPAASTTAAPTTGPFSPQPGTYWTSKTTGGLTRTFKYLAHDGSAWFWSITTLEWVSGAIVPGPNPRAILPADLAILGLPLSPPGGWPGGSGTVCLQSARDIGLGQALHDHFKDRLKTPDTMGRCSKCGAPLHAMLDAYYGRNTAVAGMCSNCRPRGA